jgi:N-methylhydantoinase B
VSAKNVDVIEYPRGTALEQTLDPITTRVIAGALESIVLEVGHKLTRMAYSSVIRESEDFGAAILDAQGRQVCECPLSTPLQLGPIPGYVRGINQIFAERGQAWHEGDVIMHNSSFHGASHQPDVALCGHRRRDRRLRGGAAVPRRQALRAGRTEQGHLAAAARQHPQRRHGGR